MSGWNFPGEADFRSEEAERRRWWAEHYPPERGQREPRCARTWRGECGTTLRPGLPRPPCHMCARPRVHPAPCMCYCSARAPEPVPPPAPRPVPRGVQETLI